MMNAAAANGASAEPSPDGPALACPDVRTHVAQHAPVVAHSEVRAELGRILASPDFSRSERLRSFLAYVVEETLAGRGDRIKAYSVATEVFKRGPSFDAQNDPIVRIEAGRLRRALERYYLLDGIGDLVVIDVPKGHYKAKFVRKPPKQGSVEPAVADVIGRGPGASTHPPRNPWRALLSGVAATLACLVLAAILLLVSRQSAQTSIAPASTTAGLSSGRSTPLVAVLPFADLGQAPTSSLYAAGLTEDVLTNLARFSGLTVLGRDTSYNVGPLADLARLRTQYSATYAVEGAVRAAGNNLRISARLIDTATGTVLWSSIYDEDTEKGEALEIQKDVAERVAATLAQPRGAIFRADEKRLRAPVDPEAYACISRYYAYRAGREADQHTAAHECMEGTVQRLPEYPSATRASLY
jgi:adenylate cyclase